MWERIRSVTGVVLVGVGIVGMLLPVLPGIPLLLVGAALLGANHPWVRPFVARLRWWRRKRKQAGADRRAGEGAGR